MRQKTIKAIQNMRPQNICARPADCRPEGRAERYFPAGTSPAESNDNFSGAGGLCGG